MKIWRLKFEGLGFMVEGLGLRLGSVEMVGAVGVRVLKFIVGFIMYFSVVVLQVWCFRVWG